jgi:hypothetical protein
MEERRRRRVEFRRDEGWDRELLEGVVVVVAAAAAAAGAAVVLLGVGIGICMGAAATGGEDDAESGAREERCERAAEEWWTC